MGITGGSTFDFSEGAHTFGVTGNLQLLNPFNDRATTFKGGTWSVTSDFSPDSSNTSFDGNKLIFDGSTFSAKRIFYVPSNLGGDVLVALTNGATLNVTGTDYCEFCRHRPNGDDPFVMDVSSGSQLNMKGSFYFMYSGGTSGDNWQNCTLRVRDSGTTFTGTGMAVGQYQPGYAMEVSDGATVTLSDIQVGQAGYSHDNTVTIRGAGTSLKASYPQIGEQYAADSRRFGATSNNWVRILDGATATLSSSYLKQFPIGPYSPFNGVLVSNATLSVDAFLLGASSAAGSNNTFWVTGPSTTVKPSLSWPSHSQYAYSPFGAGPNCSIRVEDGAKLDLSSSWKGTEIRGTNCLVRVAGKNAAANKAAHLTLSGSYELDLTGKGNRVEVLDGGQLTCGALGNSYGTRHGCGNTVVVSNATVSLGGLRLGKTATAASNNVFLATGPKTSLDGLAYGSNPYCPFGAGPGCELRFEDGVQFTTAWQFDMSGTNCLFRVSGTNEVAQKRTYVDIRDLDFSGKGNTFEVSDGAYAVCYCSHLGVGGGAGGTENTIVLSNGHFQVSQYYGLFMRGESNKLVFKGDRPRIAGPANLYAYDGAKIVFELPLGKTYDAANPPLGFSGYLKADWDGQGGANPAGSGADPEILFPNLMEYRKSIDKTVTLQLGKMYTDDRMKRVIRNTALPQGCKLSVDTSGNNITLTVRPYRGTALVIR